MKVLRIMGVGAWRGAPVPNRRRFGVPPGGPWDRESAALARAFAGLADDAPVYELLRGTAELECEVPGMVAFVGIDGSCSADGVERQVGCRFAVAAGSRLRLQSNLGYVAQGSTRFAGRLRELPSRKSVVRYLPIGGGIGRTDFTVDPMSNRAGVRLNGLAAEEVAELPSEPSCVGAIQRTASGQLIVIGADGPTIGGYPKVGTVIEADLDFVARLLPAAQVELVPVDWDTAQRETKEWSDRLEKSLDLLRSGDI